MSDTTSNSSSPGRSSSFNPALSDYPLFMPDMREVVHEIFNLSDRLDSLRERAARTRELTESEAFISGHRSLMLANHGSRLPRARGPLTPPHSAESREDAALEILGASRTPARTPVASTDEGAVNCVPTLPPTTYNEQDESSNTPNTLAYVKVQRALLDYAKTHATDSLNPRLARAWTRAIDSTGHKEPDARDALRLCYYMRSQGYDVYARFEEKVMLLYVANPLADVRCKENDALYWQQNFVDNTSERPHFPSSRRYRRNAIPHISSFVEEVQEEAQQEAQEETSAETHGARIVPAQAPVAENPALREAQVAVQALLDQEDSDPGALSAAIERLDALLQENQTSQTAAHT